MCGGGAKEECGVKEVYCDKCKNYKLYPPPELVSRPVSRPRTVQRERRERREIIRERNPSSCKNCRRKMFGYSFCFLCGFTVAILVIIFAVP